MTRSKNMGNHVVVLALCCALSSLLGCKDNATVPHNYTPEANAGPDQELDYDGSPVEVTLDGSKSSDSDGKIVKYHWRSGNLSEEDAGPRLVGPDPDDKAKPKVSLDQGQWTFVLWVEDDAGSLSVPDTVTITVGEVDGPSCNPDECPMPALGAPCCTSDDTGAEPGDPRGRGPALCGTDLGALLPNLAGICLQTGQAGEASDECPEIMGASLEPGCCTDEGLCASINESAGLGCHYPQAGPGGSCTAP